jgi:CHRD domain-containing protein
MASTACGVLCLCAFVRSGWNDHPDKKHPRYEVRSPLDPSDCLLRTLYFVLAAFFVCAPLHAQAGKTFRTRLSPVPIDLTMQATVSGSGSVSAVLSGTKLTVTGTFQGLRSPATIAQLHKSATRGVRGPVVFDLTASAGTSGTISASVDLTPAQITDLEKGLLYVQLHSEKAPDGNLWGWLLPAQAKR